MGLAEQILAGGNIKRNEISFTTSGGTGNVDLGSAYVLLSVTVDTACRLRLYDDSTSAGDSTEASRPITTTTIPNNISLIADMDMDAPGTYTVDPVVFGAMNPKAGNTYYRVDPAGTVNVKVNRFLLYDKNVSTALDSRRSISLPTNTTLSTNGIATGTLTTDAPATFLILSATCANNCRLRLYRYAAALSNTAEQNRAFSTEASPSVGLIVDAEIPTGTVYFTPKIVAANTQNLASNSLPSIRNNQSLMDGVGAIYYSIKNNGGAASFSVTLDALALEE